MVSYLDHGRCVSAAGSDGGITYRAVDHRYVLEDAFSAAEGHIKGVRGLLYSARQAGTVVWKRSTRLSAAGGVRAAPGRAGTVVWKRASRLTAAGGVAGVAVRAIEYGQRCIDEVRDVHA